MIEQRAIGISYTDPAATLTAFLPEGGGEAKKPALIVLPGGGYHVCAGPEGAPVAERFAEKGFATFVLNYSVLSTGAGHTAFPEPLREVAQTVKHLRDNAEEYGLDPEKIVLFGASAGGHLAASYGNGWDTDEVYEGFAEDPEALRPDACVLLYCASDLGEDGMMHAAIYGHDAPYSAEEIERCTIKEYVGPQTPPTILFHSAPDPDVPVRSSVELFAALQKQGIPSELHVFGGGGHAYGLGEGTPAEAWPDLAVRFLDAVFRTPELFDREYIRRMQEKMFGHN